MKTWAAVWPAPPTTDEAERGLVGCFARWRVDPSRTDVAIAAAAVIAGHLERPRSRGGWRCSCGARYDTPDVLTAANDLGAWVGMRPARW